VWITDSSHELLRKRWSQSRVHLPQVQHRQYDSSQIRFASGERNPSVYASLSLSLSLGCLIPSERGVREAI
jgi:hypothetical protein